MSKLRSLMFPKQNISGFILILFLLKLSCATVLAEECRSLPSYRLCGHHREVSWCVQEPLQNTEFLEQRVPKDPVGAAPRSDI